MSLVPAKCTQCGSNLTVESSQEAAVCPFCNTPFIAEKAINNYNTTNHINAKTVNVFQSPNSDFVIKAGVLEKYTGERENVIIPKTVKYIGQKAFASCYGISSVELNDGLIEICYDAFFGCKNLINISIPDTVEKICGGAFGYCEKLQDVSIGRGVKVIGTQAFSNCTSLKNITIPDNVEVVDSMAFMDCTSLEKIKISNYVKKISSSVFKNCTSLKNVDIPDNVLEIDIEAFRGCSTLQEVNFSKNLKRISAGAFFGCSSLTSIFFPMGIEKIDDGYDTSIHGAFYGCKNLKKINLPSSLMNKREAADAFGECTGLSDVEISSDDLISLSSKYKTSDGKEYRRMDRFKGSPFEKKINNIFEHELCLYCGGNFKGFFKKICKKCNKEKNY